MIRQNDSWFVVTWKVTIIDSNDTTNCDMLLWNVIRHNENSIFSMKWNRRQKSTFCYGKSNTVLPNQFLCPQVKPHQTNSKLVLPNQISYTFRFVSSNQVSFGGFVFVSIDFRFSELEFSLLLVFLVFLFLIFATFSQGLSPRFIILLNETSVAMVR